ncbi:MAG: DUF2059 domain-containing protein [bacterium]|nr:DUF2059 domain-containing protein [bacterium]
MQRWPIVIVCSLSVLTLAGEERVPADLQVYARAKRALVSELLHVTHAQQQAEEMLEVMLRMLPDDVQRTLRDVLKPDEMVREVIPVYEKYLTVEDLRALLAFYRTPVGQKLVRIQPQLTKDAMIVMKAYAERRIAALMGTTQRSSGGH